MARVIRGGLIQASNPRAGDDDLMAIKQAMIDKHIPMIEEAGRQGVQVLCLQEIFYGPYFCPSQHSKWYGTAEAIPDGQSYFCNPRGEFVAMGSRDQDELVLADLDMDMIREVRDTWQFYRDRRPDMYGDLVEH